MKTFKKVINKILRQTEIKVIPSEEKSVFLTFDDGPEPGITEFVLDELDKYNFKATFFCRGDNAEVHPKLMEMIREKGHAIGNHTYGHLHAYNVSTKTYINNVTKADAILHTSLFRPPHGSLTFKTWWKLKNRRIVFWSLNSEDSTMECFEYEHAIENLKSNTKAGDVVLFHFCHKHERETRQLLPVYLKWLSDNEYQCRILPQ